MSHSHQQVIKISMSKLCGHNGRHQTPSVSDCTLDPSPLCQAPTQDQTLFLAEPFVNPDLLGGWIRSDPCPERPPDRGQ